MILAFPAPRRLVVAACAALALTSSTLRVAHAQLDAGAEDLTTLEKQLADESIALTTADCANACRALASIRRAAQKICALDPDERCVAARAKADDATRRVHEACPDCAIASAPLPGPRHEERAMGKGGSPRPAPPQVDAQQPASAPPSESSKGGCASCTTSGTSPGDLAPAALAIGALAFVLRRRRVTRSR